MVWFPSGGAEQEAAPGLSPLPHDSLHPEKMQLQEKESQRQFGCEGRAASDHTGWIWGFGTTTALSQSWNSRGPFGMAPSHVDQGKEPFVLLQTWEFLLGLTLETARCCRRGKASPACQPWHIHGSSRAPGSPGAACPAQCQRFPGSIPSCFPAGGCPVSPNPTGRGTGSSQGSARCLHASFLHRVEFNLPFPVPATSLARGPGIIGDRDNLARGNELRMPPAPSGAAAEVWWQQEQQLLCVIPVPCLGMEGLARSRGKRAGRRCQNPAAAPRLWLAGILGSGRGIPGLGVAAGWSHTQDVLWMITRACSPPPGAASSPRGPGQGWAPGFGSWESTTHPTDP